MACRTDNWSTCLHTQLMSNMERYAQKVSIELDEQSLSYAEAGYYVQRLALALLDANLPHRHEIIYQMVARSIELPLGMFAIFAVGRIYFALNPDDPNLRLSTLIHDTATAQSSENANSSDQASCTSAALILVHQATHQRARNLSTNVIAQLEPVDTSIVISSTTMAATLALTNDDLARLSIVDVSKASAAFLNCTSGSTGKPKIVEHTHGSFTYFLRSMTEGYQIRSTDNILQLASCQWTTHAWEIAVSLVAGSTLVLLRPGGQLDVDYLIRTMTKKNISALISLPSIARLLAEHVASKSDENAACFSCLRAYTIGGSIVTKRHIAALLRLIENQRPLPHIIIALGTAETLGIIDNVVSSELLQTDKDWDALPIGKSMPGRQCFLLDIDSQQQITTHDIVGELCVVADDGVFKCYRGDSVSTSRTKVSLPKVAIASDLYIRTGDLCQYNKDRDIVYVGRKDFRVKIYGQLVEPEVIEQIVMEASDLVMGCVVRKEEVKESNDEYLSCHLLVTSAVDSRDLVHRIEVYCRQYLPAFMVPVAWQMHSKFPLTPSGKIARKELGEIQRTNSVGHSQKGTCRLLDETNRNLMTKDELVNEWEKRVYAIWCELLPMADPTAIGVTAHLFSLGGNSFQFMNIITAYRSHFGCSTYFPTITAFFEHATIRGHARLLKQTFGDGTTAAKKWTLQALHATEGSLHPGQAWILYFAQAMFAMEPSAQWPHLNISLPLIIGNGSVSIRRLREALHRIIVKNAILHTSFHLDTQTNKWFQRIEPLANDNEGFTFALSEGLESDDEVNRLVMREFSIQGLFDTERGQLVRLHIVRRTKAPPINEDLLQVGDIIIFNIRHEAIDGTSIPIFFSDLVQAYDRGELDIDPNAISYLDYTLYQSRIDRSASVAYWTKVFDGVNMACSRAITRMPSDRPWLLNPYTITLPIPIPFRLDDKIALSMIECARENNVTVANLCLACHYAFLIDLTGEWDLVVTCTAARRPFEPEAAKILGPFADYIISRVSLDKKMNPTFITLLQQTHAVMMESFDHLLAEQDSFWADHTKKLDADQQYSDFQFDEKLQDVVLDKNVQLHHLLDPSDGMPIAIWWRVVAYAHFSSSIIYDPQAAELFYAFVFSTTTYERSTAHHYVVRFQAMLERIFGDKTRPIDRQTQPLSFWLKQATTIAD